MYFLTFIEILASAALSFYLIHSYSHASVKLYVKICVLIAWVMNFSLILLVPLDIYINSRNHSANIPVESDPAFQHLSAAYAILYWTIFVISWTLLPAIQEYEDAVDLDFNDKIRRSFNNNMKFYMAAGGASVLFIIYIYVAGIANDVGLFTFLKSLANSFGVFLIIVLLGYSLVTIPRSQLRTTNYEL